MTHGRGVYHPPLTPRVEALLALVRQHPEGITQADASRALDFKAQDYLDTLTDRGFARRVEEFPDGTNAYQIVIYPL